MWRNLSKFLFIALLVIWVGSWFYLLEPGIAGFIYDDGLYLQGAKSLAEGHGYVINQHLPIVKYPPLYSIVLSFLWRLYPDFPANVILFKALSAVFALMALACFTRWAWRQERYHAWELGGLLLLVASNPFFVREITEVMAEALYLLLTVLGLGVLTHLHKREALRSFRGQLVLALISVAIFYTKSIGFTFMLGVFLWLAFEQGRRAAWTYLLMAVVMMLPWFFWVSVHPASGHSARYFIFYPYNQSYFQEWWNQALVMGSPWGMLWDGFPKLLQALGDILLPWLGLNPGFALLASLFGMLVLCLMVAWMIRDMCSMRNQSCLFPVLFYVLCYLGMLAFWGGQGMMQFHRLLVPVLPFLLLLLLDQLKSIPALRGRSVMLVGLLALILMGNLRLLWGTFQERMRPDYISEKSLIWGDYQATFQAINRLTQPQDRIFTQYPMVYSLYTHLAFDQGNLMPRRDVTVTSAKAFRGFANELCLAGNQYVVLEPASVRRHMFAPYHPLLADTIRQFPTQYQLVYTSPHGVIRLYRLLPCQTNPAGR